MWSAIEEPTAAPYAPRFSISPSSPVSALSYWMKEACVMNVIELARTLIDIESVTPNEEDAGRFVYQLLSQLAYTTNGAVELIEVEPRRFNVFATWGQPLVTLSTTSIQFLHFSHPQKMTSSSGAAGHATLKASSPP